jgi:hypothetical protein
VDDLVVHLCCGDAEESAKVTFKHNALFTSRFLEELLTKRRDSFLKNEYKTNPF